MKGAGKGALFAAAAAAIVAACAPAWRGVETARPTASAASAAPGEEMLAPERIARLPAVERAAWEAYLTESERLAEADRMALDAEVAALGLNRWTPAPPTSDRILQERRTDEWFFSEEARRLADVVLSYQTPAGGWSKNIDYRLEPREQGQNYYSTSSWSYIGTFDNDATTDELNFLARVHAAQPDDRYRDAFLGGLEYTLRAQYPSGCWPQIYPLQGGYHDAATYNDEAIPNILYLLRSVARGDIGFVPLTLRARAGSALEAGIGCVLATQVVVDGRRTVWGQQHDPISFEPVDARAYEHASLTGGESVDVVEFLMSVESPDPQIVESVHAAVEWFRATAIHGFDYRHPELIERPGGGPIWARFYEIGTDRPIFSNRDGGVLYSWYEVDEERRTGYAWYRTTPVRLLRAYDAWAALHPRR